MISAISSTSIHSRSTSEREQPIVITMRSQPLHILSNTPALQVRIQEFHQRCTVLGLAELIQFLPNDGKPQALAIAIEQYCHFLCLIDLYPDRELVPTPALDQVWHAHILDTQRYRRDCLALFGRFIDHQPFGIHASNLQNCVKSSAETLQLLRHHFQIDFQTDVSREGTAIAPMNSANSPDLASPKCGACGRGLSNFSA